MDDVAEYLDCAICLEKLTDPRMLPCQHTFCLKCLASVLERHGTSMPCPSCRQVYAAPSADSLAPNRLVVQLLDTLEKRHQRVPRQCEDCVDPKPAEGFCQDCQLYFCEPCVRHHKSSKRSQYHRMLLATGVDQQESDALCKDAWLKREPICEKHNSERMEVYCRDHQTAACYKCVVLEHRPCDYASLAEVSDFKVGEIHGSIAQLHDFSTIPLKEAIRLTQNQEHLSSQHTSTLMELIEGDFEEMKTILEEHKKLLQHVVALKRAEDKLTLEQNLARITADLHRVQQVSSAAEDLVKNFCRTEIMYQAKATLADLTAVQGSTKVSIDLGKWTVQQLHYVPSIHSNIPRGNMEEACNGTSAKAMATVPVFSHALSNISVAGKPSLMMPTFAESDQQMCPNNSKEDPCVEEVLNVQEQASSAGQEQSSSTGQEKLPNTEQVQSSPEAQLEHPSPGVEAEGPEKLLSSPQNTCHRRADLSERGGSSAGVQMKAPLQDRETRNGGRKSLEHGPSPEADDYNQRGMPAATAISKKKSKKSKKVKN